MKTKEISAAIRTAASTTHYTETKGAEMRVASSGRKLEGYAAVFNRESVDLFPGFREILVPGCFTRVLESPDLDCKAHLVNHNGDVIPLGRTKAGTLRLRQDEKGLYCEIDLPDTTGGRDIYESVKRGDITQMSFMFRTAADGSGEEWMWSDSSSMPVRYVHEVSELLDVTPATFPAYKDTTLMARSLTAALERSADPEAKQMAEDFPLLVQVVMNPDMDLQNDSLYRAGLERSIKYFQGRLEATKPAPDDTDELDELRTFLEFEQLRG